MTRETRKMIGEAREMPMVTLVLSILLTLMPFLAHLVTILGE